MSERQTAHTLYASCGHIMPAQVHAWRVRPLRTAANFLYWTHHTQSGPRLRHARVGVRHILRFSCAKVRFGNTKTCPNGGHAPSCGCFECARRTQGPRFHLGASLVHVVCRTARQVNVFAVLRLCLAVANRCCIWVCEVHWYLHVTCNALACIGPRLSEGL